MNDDNKKIIQFPQKSLQEKLVEEAAKRDKGFRAASNAVQKIKEKLIPKKAIVELINFLICHFGIKKEEILPDCILRMEMAGFKLKQISYRKNSGILEKIKNETLNDNLGRVLAIRIVKLAKYCYNIA